MMEPVPDIGRDEEWVAEIQGPMDAWLMRYYVTFHQGLMQAGEFHFTVTEAGAQRKAERTLRRLRRDDYARKNRRTIT
jgi:hypothetical protein